MRDAPTGWMETIEAGTECCECVLCWHCRCAVCCIVLSLDIRMVHSPQCGDTVTKGCRHSKGCDAWHVVLIPALSHILASVYRCAACGSGGSGKGGGSCGLWLMRTCTCSPGPPGSRSAGARCRASPRMPHPATHQCVCHAQQSRYQQSTDHTLVAMWCALHQVRHGICTTRARPQLPFLRSAPCLFQLRIFKRNRPCGPQQKTLNACILRHQARPPGVPPG